MNTITTAIKQFVADEDGITAIEYGLMAAVVATALIAAGSLLEDGFSTAFTAITDLMDPANVTLGE